MAERDAAYMPVHMEARDIPPPSTISLAARQALSDGAAMPRTTRPSPDDKEGWRQQNANVDAMWEERAAPI
mgnify:CR=1 FL=1